MPNNGTFCSKEIQAFVSRPLYDPNILSSKDSSYPKISVVIPSYNQVQFLERTILSVLNQNYPNTEIIIIDGSSKDGSIELIKKYEPYISYWVSEPDKGQSNAINKGFKMASGDIIGWQNSDDIYLPGFFCSAAESFQKYPKLELFVGNVYVIDEDDRITFEFKFPPFSVNELIYFGWNLSSQAVFLSRRVVKNVGLMREDIEVSFDWDWFIRVGKVVRHTALYKGFCGCYRMQPNQKLAQYSPESRWQIEAEILQSHGVRVEGNRSLQQQLWWRSWFYKIRLMFYTVVLYSPKPLFRHLRLLILWYLERRNIICKGFA